MSASSPALRHRATVGLAWYAPVAVPLVLLALLTLLLWLSLRAAPPLVLDVGMPGDARFLSGFYLPEQGGGRTFRWSGPEARFVLHGASAGPVMLRLQLNGERLALQPDPSLYLTRAELVVAQFAVADGWRDYHVLLPPTSLATPGGHALPLELRTALLTPGETPNDLDLRALGVPLAELELSALPPGQRAALPRALWLSWLLALLGGTWAWLEAWLRPGWRATRWMRTSLLVALGGSSLLAWAWREPYGLAWALPPLPWTLGTATLLLAVLALGQRRQRQPSFASQPVYRYTEQRLAEPTASIGEPDSPSSPVSLSPMEERRNSTRFAVPVRASEAATWLASPWALLGGLALLAVAGGLLATQAPAAVGTGLALSVAALLLLSVGPHSLGAHLWMTRAPDFTPRRALLLLGLIFMLALGLRFFRLDQLPFGLWRDEARHGLFAQLIRDYPGYRPIYIASERVNMPALGLYPFAVALQLWGEQLWSMRIISGLAGALTVLPLYALTTMLSGRRAVGLLAALLLAVSSWQISVSRLAFPTVFDPLLTLSGLALLLWSIGRAQRSRGAEEQGNRRTEEQENRGTGEQGSRRTGHHAEQPSALGARRSALMRSLAGLAAGVCIGLAVQTYHTGRVAPLVAGWLGLLLLLRDWRNWRGWLVVTLAAALGLLLTLAPLLGYALRQPAAFNDRVSAVFLLSPEALGGQAPLAVLDDALRRHLLMFHVAGDENGRHHNPGSPLLDYVTGLGMLLGLAALLRWPSDWRVHFLLGALALGLLPSALAINAPHALRAFAALAFACIIAALGWAALWRSLRARAPALRPAIARSVAVALLSFAVALNALTYFVVMPPQYEVFLGFYPVQSRMGAYVRELADQDALPPQIFVPAGLQTDPVFAFLTTGLPVQTFSGAQLSTPAEPGAIFLLSGYFVEREAADLAPILGPAAEPIARGPMFPDGSRRTFYVYQMP